MPGPGGQDVEFASQLAAIAMNHGYAKGANHAGMLVGQNPNRGPVGLGRGRDVEQIDPGVPGAGKDLGQIPGEARILQVAMSVAPDEFLDVRGRGGWYAHG